MKLNKIILLFYPLLNLNIFEKIKFVSIALFSLIVILIDISTISVISLIFFDANNSINSKTKEFLEVIYNFFYFEIEFFYFQFVIVALILFLRNFFFLAQEFIIKSFVFRQYNVNSKKLFHLYASSNILKFYRKGIDYYLKNLNRETWYCYIGVLYAILYLVVDIIYFNLIIFFGFKILNINITLDFLFPVLIFIFFVSIIFFFLRKKGVERKNYEQKFYTDTLNILKSVLEIQTYKKINFFTNSFSKYLAQYSKSIVFAGVANLAPKAIIEIIASIIIVYYLIFNNLSLNLELFTLIAFILFRVGPVISRIIQNISLTIFFAPASKILINEFKIFRNQRNSKKYVIKDNVNSISLLDASFNYGKNRILKNFNYNFKKNKIYGIYGNSGRGKTTLLMILSNLISLDKGFIKINNFKKINRNLKIDWGNKLGFMSQYNILVDDSLINSLFLEDKISKDKINKAKKYLRKFNLQKLIKLLNKKYDGTYSLGGMLSGGEKQRLSLIRTILLSKEIMLLDEPTSSLDKKNENIILKELKRIKQNKIIILSTHKQNLKDYFDEFIDFK